MSAKNDGISSSRFGDMANFVVFIPHFFAFLIQSWTKLLDHLTSFNHPRSPNAVLYTHITKTSMSCMFTTTLDGWEGEGFSNQLNSLTNLKMNSFLWLIEHHLTSGGPTSFVQHCLSKMENGIQCQL